MSREDDIAQHIKDIADKGNNEERLALGTPGDTVIIDGTAFKTGQLWTTNPSFVVLMVEGLARYFDDFMEEVEQKIEDAL
jgi:hypothetical protein